MKQIFLFIVLMRALAAIIITNSHYVGVYPTDLIANGGLLGDVLFFAVSGYCLANVKGSFGKWYLRRFIRVYIPVWICTLAYMLIGAYSVPEDPVQLALFYLWPIRWHFITSIILLYIPLFFVAKYIELNYRNYSRLAGGILLLQLVLYVTLYDNSYYHIDNVRQPMIEFLFFQSMLMGAHYRWRCSLSLRDGESVMLGAERRPYGLLAGAVGLFVLYFSSKMLFAKMPFIAELQLLNPLILLVLLYVLFRIFMQTERALKAAEGKKAWKIVQFIADRTLEIYLVQPVVLKFLRIGPFPLNWLLLTTVIIVAAILLRWSSQMIIRRIS